jgi:hypothetical protein
MLNSFSAAAGELPPNMEISTDAQPKIVPCLMNASFCGDRNRDLNAIRPRHGAD